MRGEACNTAPSEISPYGVKEAQKGLLNGGSRPGRIIPIMLNTQLQRLQITVELSLFIYIMMVLKYIETLNIIFGPSGLC